MSTFFDIFTLIISTILFIKTIKKIGLSTRYIFYYFFFIICVVPLYLDYIVGLPVYTSWLLGSKNYGFILSYNDTLTRIIYDIFLIFYQYILLYYKRDKEKELNLRKNKSFSALDFSKKSKKLVFIGLVFLAILPTVLVIILPLSNSILYTLEWREQNLFGASSSPYYIHVEKLSYLGVISSLLLLFINPKYYSKKNSRFLFFLKPLWIIFAFFNMCIESKRSILIFSLAIVVTYLINTIPRKKMFRVLIVSGFFVAFILLLSIYVKTTYRSYSVFDALYTTLRIDYFRDDTIKMSIYSLFNDEIKILNFPFQSYIMQIGYIFPLDIFDVPRLGYNTFFTCALLNKPISAGYSYTTTSFIDELVANFGIIGLIISPFFSLSLSRLADKQDIILKVFIVACYVLLVMYPLCYITWFIETTVVLLIVSKFQVNKEKYGGSYVRNL